MTELELVIKAAEELADAVEDTLYVEGDHREALVTAWRNFCGVMDMNTDPAINAAQASYFKDRDALPISEMEVLERGGRITTDEKVPERELVEERVRIVNTPDGLRQQTERVYKQREV